MKGRVERYSKRYYDNGAFQRIYWLGVNGFMIVNEPDKEILLIDPWPSYAEEPSGTERRVEELADYLLQVYATGYRLEGVIATHEHFDHFADIPSLYLALCTKGMQEHALPRIYSDQGTFDAIASTYEQLYDRYHTPRASAPSLLAVDSLKKKHVAFTLNGKPLYYDDEFQERKKKRCSDPGVYPLMAGTRLRTLQVGHYLITPYIWDHSTSFDCYESMSSYKSGNLQRATSFLLECASDPERKRLFSSGSAGEMSLRRAGRYVKNTRIETDVLIQAMPHELLAYNRSYEDKLKDLVAYQKRNIRVNDAIIACHYENFFYLKSIDRESGDHKLRHNLERIARYANELRGVHKATRTVYFLDRLLIEFGTEVAH